MILFLVVRRFWAGVDSDFCTAVFVCVCVGFGLDFLVSSSVITGAVVCGGMCAVDVIFVVGAVPIAWNATNALCELAGFFFCLGVILVLAERRFGATVLGVDTKVIIPRVIGVVGVGLIIFVFGVVFLDFLASVVIRHSLPTGGVMFVVVFNFSCLTP